MMNQFVGSPLGDACPCPRVTPRLRFRQETYFGCSNENLSSFRATPHLLSFLGARARHFRDLYTTAPPEQPSNIATPAFKPNLQGQLHRGPDRYLSSIMANHPQHLSMGQSANAVTQDETTVPNIYVLWGPTGSGKSHRALVECGDNRHFTRSICTGNWSGYNRQSYIIIEHADLGCVAPRELVDFLRKGFPKARCKGSKRDFSVTHVWLTAFTHPSEWMPRSNAQARAGQFLGLPFLLGSSQYVDACCYTCLHFETCQAASICICWPWIHTQPIGSSFQTTSLLSIAGVAARPSLLR